jgi:hypothetical protein
LAFEKRKVKSQKLEAIYGNKLLPADIMGISFPGAV